MTAISSKSWTSRWRSLLKATAAAMLTTLIAFFSLTANAWALGLGKLEGNPWEVVPLPTEESMLDISFTENPNHGWMVGTNSKLLETKDAGKTWQERELMLGEQKYRFSSIDFAGDEGWVAGQPAIMLHTTDAGASWEQIPLSDKLPGSPETMTAIDDDTAEMVTDLGAIYRTDDAGRHWKALVNDAFGVMKSLHRSNDGQYVAVSSRGNFFSTWAPGEESWQPHNRNSSRRLQTMGFAPDNRLWLLARGGVIQLTNSADAEDWGKSQNPANLNSWGFLDLAYRTPTEAWIVGGSGTLLASMDGGQTWKTDKDVEDVPANLYKIKFLDESRGYVLGQRGTFLRYVG
jgi:photosystem II stability/assembly factor-like uncharacterized protein